MTNARMKIVRFASVITFGIAILAACGSSSQMPMTPLGLSMSLLTTTNSPLLLVEGQTATLTLAPNTSYITQAWSVWVTYPTAPQCAVALQTANSPSGAFVFTVSSAQNSGQPSSFPPCGVPPQAAQTITFSAGPSPSGSATPSAQWTQNLYVEVLPSPTPT